MYLEVKQRYGLTRAAVTARLVASFGQLRIRSTSHPTYCLLGSLSPIALPEFVYILVREPHIAHPLPSTFQRVALLPHLVGLSTGAGKRCRDGHHRISVLTLYSQSLCKSVSIRQHRCSACDAHDVLRQVLYAGVCGAWYCSFATPMRSQRTAS